MTDLSAPIGVFDSGIGGLNILDLCVKNFPHENFCYLGDNRRAPYGNKSVAELNDLLLEAVGLFLKEGVKAVVVACNTLSTNCLVGGKTEWPVPLVGTFPALEKGRGCRRLLILATEATLRSGFCTFPPEGGKAELSLFAPVGLVADIEKNAPCWKNIGIEKHFYPLQCDGVVLGCTHFLFLRKEISSFFHAPCFDGGENTVKSLQKCLKGRFNPQKERGAIYFIGASHKKNQSLYQRIFFDSNF